MGNFSRRGAAVGSITLAALLMAPAAMADTDGAPLDVDNAPSTVTAPGIEIQRFADKDPIGTAIQAANRTNLPWSKTVIVANSEVFADTLAATPLADRLDAPVLLSQPGTGSLDPRVAKYIDENNIEEVILVGGNSIFNSNVRAQVDAIPSVNSHKQFNGNNRYETAVKLSVATLEDMQNPHLAKNSPVAPKDMNVFFASGLNYPDALAAGAAAADTNGVVLLTKGAEGMDAYTFAAIAAGELTVMQNHGSSYAVGGPGVAGVQAGWAGTPIEVQDTVSGADRYETAKLLAEKFFNLEDKNNSNSTQTRAVMSHGKSWADSVVAGAYAANVDAPLLLNRADKLNNVNREYLENNRMNIDQMFVFGGPSTISTNVTDTIRDDVRWIY